MKTKILNNIDYQIDQYEKKKKEAKKEGNIDLATSYLNMTLGLLEARMIVINAFK